MMMKNLNSNIYKNNNINEVNAIKQCKVNEINTNEPKHYKTLKYHADTISQIVFNPNK
jgi:hypothetical protein